MKNLEEGLEKLQRANRRNRLFIALFVLVAVAAAVIQAPAAPNDPVPKVIRAHAFQVVDNEGRVLIDLHGPGSGANITLFNREGRAAIALMGTQNYGAIATYDGDGEPLVTTGKTADGIGALKVYDASKRMQLISLTGRKSGGELRVMNGIVPGSPVCILRANEAGDGVIAIWDHQMKGRMLTPRK